MCNWQGYGTARETKKERKWKKDDNFMLHDNKIVHSFKKKAQMDMYGRNAYLCVVKRL